MDHDFEYDVSGAPVIYSDLKPPPYNPLKRPEISYKKPLLAIIIYFLVCGLISIIAVNVSHDLKAAFAGFALWSVLYFLIIGKKGIIWLVHLYQNKAPDRVRLKCVFEPSCSEYMIAAIVSGASGEITAVGHAIT